MVQEIRSVGHLLGARRRHCNRITKGLAIRRRKSFYFKRLQSAGKQDLNLHPLAGTRPST